MSKTKFYHYTPTFRIEQILQNKQIKPSVMGLGKNEKPITWISSNQFWENTATKLVRTESGTRQLTFYEQVTHVGCARIEVKPNNLIPWKSLKHQAKIDRKMAAALVESGKKMGANPYEWYGRLSSIKIDQWLQIEEYRDGEWLVTKKFNH